MAIDEKKLIEESTWYPDKMFAVSASDHYRNGWNDCNRDWLKRFKELSLENKTSDKWIPYDDEHEKPNEVGWYRVTEFSFLITRIINFRFWNGYRFEGCEEIIAWQPNPEPYKGLLQEKEK